MRHLLDNSTRRRLELLELLNQSANWVSSNELATKLNASLRTINSDVQFLKENWMPHLMIETSKKNGVRLTTPSNSHVQEIYSEIAKESEAFNILEKIFFTPTRNLEDWENELYISYSSLYRISQQLNEVAKKYDLQLKNNPFHINNHNEINVRYFFVNFFHEIHFIRSWPFSIDRKKILELSQFIFNTFLNSNENELDDLLIVYLAYIICVSITRQSQGFFTNKQDWDVLPRQYFDTMYGDNHQLEAIYKEANLPLTEDAIFDLMNSIYFFKRDIIPKTQWDEVSDSLERFTLHFEELMEVAIDPDSRKMIQRTLKIIYLHHMEYQHKDEVIFDRYAFNGQSIKASYPGYSKFLEYSLKKLEKETNFPWFSVYYYNVIYWIMVKWKNLPLILDDKKDKARILVFSDHGHHHARLLSELIEKSFTYKVIITTYTEPSFNLDAVNPEIFSDYDLVVSNFSHPIFPVEKLILVNAFPSNSEWGKIRNAINAINVAPTNIIKKMDELMQAIEQGES